ncbi:recombination regulator RecX [Caballeronia sp. SBC2]|uniref:recombination regulator RecX n=1 Tax=Caballeronia sp. SBC2 TaxID=2705547 RepID=UPI0013E14555|nr:recombination regulator RecX [Caballeronia sp. SBC2]QIE22618.1 Regulatory protein RecX [Caballeronia sp. SBC2]
MMRSKSRFGSKTDRDSNRDAEQDVKEDPDGSKSISDEDESPEAEEGVDRYERSSDRYRAAAGERAGAEKSAPARRSFGNSFSKSGGVSGEKSGSGGFKGGGFSSGKSAGSGGSSSGSSFARKSSFGRSGGSSASASSGSSKAEAIAASLQAAAAGETTQEDHEPVFERSSDRAYPKRGSFGGGASARSASDRVSADAPAEYERSSDRSKFGRGGLTGRKASGLGTRGKSSPNPADGGDVFERSTDRKTSRRAPLKSAKPADEHSGEIADIVVAPQVGQQQIEPAQPDSVAALDAVDTEERLRRARAVLEQAHAVVQSQAAPAKAARKSQSKPAVISPGVVGETGTDIADPFEPFEQCVPSATQAVSESQVAEPVYSRGSTGRSKTPATDDSKRKGPQLSLRGRALGYLSRREHSRAELSRKLTPHLGEGDSLDTLLDALEREGWLSNERFVESVVHRRGTRLGTSRIVNELKRNGIDETLIQDAGAELKKTELTRAREVWSKKFGEPPTTPAERAKQARFLATRGFNGGTIVKVLKAGDDEFIDE